ncbi:MAG: FAD binding domain-containing protein [Acidobacteria bacterium]|nr:FAD binding domain-containing protein [Acidobacteriota bacterium]
MRSDPAEFGWLSPTSLAQALEVLAEDSNQWLPIAGGTDVMVQYAAGTLPRRKLLNLWNLRELREIKVFSGEVEVGAGATYTDLRSHPVIAGEFPLLARAASWTGGIANQNRGTLGGNIVNASPAADSLPALLAYEAELILVSRRGERRFPYGDFHIGYKRMNLTADELIRAICLPRRFSGYISYSRKVGPRAAQAISKVCIAALARVARTDFGLMVQDVRIALGSVAPVPMRLTATERLLKGKSLDREQITAARRALSSEIAPISDLRSTASYRTKVAGNLLEEFLQQLLKG